MILYPKSFLRVALLFLLFILQEFVTVCGRGLDGKVICLFFIMRLLLWFSPQSNGISIH